MRKIKILLLVTVVLFQSCKTETTHKKNDVKEKVQTIENFCYINKVQKKDGKVSVAVDFIEYLKTKDLDSAIIKSSIIELPNGFSYSNKEVKLDEVELTKNSKIVLQTFSYSKDGNFKFNQVVTSDEFVNAFNSSEPKPFKFSPFRIKLENRTITSLTEIYIP